MRELLDFIVKKKHWFLFLFLEVISFTLILKNNEYQRSVIFSSANVVIGKVASLSGNVSSYFNLRKINESLSERNGHLEMQLLQLEDKLALLKADAISFKGEVKDSTQASFPYDFVMAKVVYNSVGYLSNYITIDKGSRDGVATDMGVVSELGVVGVVSNVSDRFSVVIPILNPKSKLSCKIKGNSHFGSIAWDGRDTRYAKMERLPKYVPFQVGDTIVTSSFSTIFPQGIAVGTIDSYENQSDDKFYSIKVKLFTDFGSLSNVRVIRNQRQKEQQELEKERDG
jgi:rod shape-determining protein MreC